jgi:hypothetical protein
MGHDLIFRFLDFDQIAKLRRFAGFAFANDFRVRLEHEGFSPAVAEALRPQIEAIVDRMLEPMRHASEADILRDIAYPLPVCMIAEMLGVPETLHEQFIRWSDAVATYLGSPNKTAEQARLAQEAILAQVEFFRGALADRRQKRGGDLISLLLDIAEDSEVLTEEELYAQCVMLLGAGHETTRNLIECTRSCGILKKWPSYAQSRNSSARQWRNYSVLKARFNSLHAWPKRIWKSATSEYARES